MEEAHLTWNVLLKRRRTKGTHGRCLQIADVQQDFAGPGKAKTHRCIFIHGQRMHFATKIDAALSTRPISVPIHILTQMTGTHKCGPHEVTVTERGRLVWEGGGGGFLGGGGGVRQCGTVLLAVVPKSRGGCLCLGAHSNQTVPGVTNNKCGPMALSKQQ